METFIGNLLQLWHLLLGVITWLQTRLATRYTKKDESQQDDSPRDSYTVYEGENEFEGMGLLFDEESHRAISYEYLEPAAIVLQSHWRRYTVYEGENEFEGMSLLFDEESHRAIPYEYLEPAAIVLQSHWRRQLATTHRKSQKLRRQIELKRAIMRGYIARFKLSCSSCGTKRKRAHLVRVGLTCDHPVCLHCVCSSVVGHWQTHFSSTLLKSTLPDDGPKKLLTACGKCHAVISQLAMQSIMPGGLVMHALHSQAALQMLESLLKPDMMAFELSLCRQLSDFLVPDECALEAIKSFRIRAAYQAVPTSFRDWAARKIQQAARKAFNKFRQDCKICCETMHVSDLHFCHHGRCQARYCSGCHLNYIESQKAAGAYFYPAEFDHDQYRPDSDAEDDLTNIKCMDTNCHLPLTVSEVSRLAPNIKLISRKQFLKEARSRNIVGIFDFWRSRRGGSEQITKTVEFVNYDRNVRICPDCFAVIFRYEGCDDMICVCKNSFDMSEAKTVEEMAEMLEPIYEHASNLCIQDQAQDLDGKETTVGFYSQPGMVNFIKVLKHTLFNFFLG